MLARYLDVVGSVERPSRNGHSHATRRRTAGRRRGVQPSDRRHPRRDPRKSRSRATRGSASPSPRASSRRVLDLVGGGLEIAGIYPNVLTVLPGTRLARALAVSGAALDFYRVPRTTEFEDLEDGAVGHNFATLGFDRDQRLRTGVVEASMHLSSLGGRGTAPHVASTARERSVQ